MLFFRPPDFQTAHVKRYQMHFLPILVNVILVFTRGWKIKNGSRSFFPGATVLQLSPPKTQKMGSVETELWNIFTYYTLHGNALDPGTLGGEGGDRKGGGGRRGGSERVEMRRSTTDPPTTNGEENLTPLLPCVKGSSGGGGPAW